MTLTAIKPTSSLALPPPPVANVAGTATPTPSAIPNAATASDSKSEYKIRQVSREFEAMLVRQMLTAAGMGGAGKDGVYGGMEVDALAKAVTQGHGLGLAQQIADALARETHAPKKE